MTGQNPIGPSVGHATTPETYLGHLAKELMRAGWAALPRYEGPAPVLHVFAAAVPNLGESISAVPGPNPHEHWYRSSTGTLLAPCTDPRKAAETITHVLFPWVNAALGRHTPPQERPSPSPVARELLSRFPDTVTWWGEQTHQWWALVPYGTSSRLITASTPEELARVIAQTRH